MHLNTWLYDQGLLALRPGVTPGEDTGDFFRGVDWSRTKAYALGLGAIYLNLKGREEQGIVDPADAEQLKARITAAMEGLVDPERRQVAVRRVVTREQIYAGPYASEAPDLVVNFAAGYRVSWETALGGTAATQFADNVRKWGGDHIIDPCLAPGMLLMNRPFRGDSARLLDMAPTILEALGVPKAPAMEGDSLLI
jgi:predicted AlkP superfamily phosphohydrolase/phosphomutase